jgi:DNA-directed RNA polymerase specialized sigma24 family protein
MAAFDALSSQLVVDLLRDDVIRKRLQDIAFASTRSRADADDLVQNALLRVLDPDDAPWDPEKVPFLKHVGRVMRQTWDESLRRARVKREVPDGNLTQDETIPDSSPAADSGVARTETSSLQRMLMKEVLAEIGDKHPIARQVFELGAEGIEDPRELMATIGCTFNDVHLAIKQLRYHARRALERWDMAEEQRMRELQGAGKKAATEGTP